MKSSVPILVTFPVSHFCEKARWALQFFNVEFEEAAHAPPFHRSAARGTVPALLIDESRRILGSDAIVEFAKSNATKNESAAKKPAPDAARLATMDELGVRTRQWAYFYILQDRALALDQLAPIDGVPSNERWWLSWSMWALVPLMRSGLNVSEETCESALSFVSQVFDDVEKVLSEQPFLSGEEFGCLDINFCSLAAPVILPPQMPLYNALFDRLNDDSAIKVTVRRFRARPAGKFVLKCYEKYRK